MAIHKLSDAFVKKAACTAINIKTGKPVVHARFGDGGNLWLDVTKSGAKAWMFVWFDKTANKQRERGLGGYPLVSLKDARIAAEAGRVEVRKGNEPVALKIVVGPVTFGAMLDLTIEKHKPSWKAKEGVYEQEGDWRGKIKTHAANLLDMPVSLVTKAMVVEVLAPIWHDKRTTADRTRFIIEAVIDTAIEEGEYLQANPALTRTVVSKFGKRAKIKVVKQPSLAYAKVPAAIATLLATGKMDAKASVFCTLTATRSDEARLMQWSEINWAEKLWVVPAERMKVENENDAEGDHYVPLSDAAIAVLRSITPVVGNPYVFAGQKAGQAIGKGALNVCIAGTKRKGGILFLQGEATQHGMRSSFITWAKEVGKVERDVRELCIAHKVGETDSERSYDRAQMLDERRAALQAWGNYATGVSNVVALKVAA